MRCLTPGLFAAPSLLLSLTLQAQVRVSPTGVSVNAMAATTVFLTFGAVGSLVPAEAFWCGETIPATPHIGRRCDPATLFGQLPARNNLSRASGDVFTDIMSIPPSVVRRAYQAAVDGATSTFFYVRRFRNLSGGLDQFVVVTCRLTGGGARVPFALTDVQIAFDPSAQVLFVAPGATLPRLAAAIQYNGTGRLVGRWEVVLPGEEPPGSSDLVTEATLLPAERANQRRFTPIERFNVFLPPNGGARFALPGPDPAKLPTAAEGSYLILLRVEATDDREGDSDLAAVGAGTGIVHSGAVAGFPLPTLRYVVGSGESVLAASTSPRALRLVSPDDGAKIDSTLTVSWLPEWGAAFYRVEFTTGGGTVLFEAIMRQGSTRYAPPPALTPARQRAGGHAALARGRLGC